MAKKQGAIREGSIADGWLKGFNAFISELSMGETGPEAEGKRRLKRREMYPEMQLDEQKRQDKEGAAPGRDPDAPKEFLDPAPRATDGVMENAREDPEMNKLYEDRFKAPSGARGEMFDTTQLPTISSDSKRRTESGPEKGPTAQSVKASAGRLLNPVGAGKVPGQSVDQGGVHGGPLSERPPASSETVAMQDTIADLQARIAKMELGGGSTPDYGTPDNPFGAIREPAAPPPPSANARVHGAGMAGGRRGIDQAVRAGNEKDVASGGGNRGLLAAIGGALGGARDAITGGPRPGLKPQYKDLTNVEIARLERQGIDVYESGVKPLPAMGGALSGGPALGSSMGTPMPPSPLGVK